MRWARSAVIGPSLQICAISCPICSCSLGNCDRIHLTKQFAAELGEQGIRVNCVAPGPVRTKLAMAVHAPEIISAYYDAIPLNRYGEAREIAEAIVFLCSDKASFISGQTLAADGGFDATGVGLPALRRENDPA